MKTQTRIPSAFTLIELLTVIAIIGILAAIIIPVAGSVRRSARQAQCLSNLRQLGTMAITYAADNRDTTIKTRDDGNTWGENLLVWSGVERGTMVDYIKCGENKIQTWAVGSGESEYENSYMINGYNEDGGPDENRYTGMSASAFTAPSQLYMFMEGCAYRSEWWSSDGSNAIPATAHPGKGVKNARYPHKDKMNVVFADGHAETISGPLIGCSGGPRVENDTTNGIHWFAN